MKVKLAILAGCIIICAAIGFYVYNEPRRGISDTKADMQITAGDLYRDFQRDETLANKKYLSKVIEVTGNVSDVQNVSGSQVILLSSEDEMGGVSCQLSNDQNNKSIVKKSTSVTIKGKCSGYLMDVNLVDCVLK